MLETSYLTRVYLSITMDDLMRKQRAVIVSKKLEILLPDAKCSLIYSNPLQLLIATILSAQCTDRIVNKVTEKVFKKYKNIGDYLNAEQKEFEADIKSTGLYRAKARNILASARIIKEKYNDAVPKTMNELLTLSGVARKTANIVMGNAYGIIDGIAVDTHVRRLSQKFGLTTNNNPVKIEQDLMKLIPKNDWLNFSHRMIEYGRVYSPANKKNDNSDPISKALGRLN